MAPSPLQSTSRRTAAIHSTAPFAGTLAQRDAANSVEHALGPSSSTPGQQIQKNVGAIRYPTWIQYFGSEIDHPALEHCDTPVGDAHKVKPTRAPAHGPISPSERWVHTDTQLKLTYSIPATLNAQVRRPRALHSATQHTRPSASLHVLTAHDPSSTQRPRADWQAWDYKSHQPRVNPRQVQT